MVLKKRSNLLFIVAVCVTGLMGLSACKSALLGEAAFIVPENVQISSSTAKAARTIGALKRGDEVTILEKNNEGGESYVRIKSAEGLDGWTVARNLITKSNSEKSKEFAAGLAQISVQAICKNRSSVKLRTTADRTSDDNVLVQLPAGLSFEIVDRETRPKAADKAAPTASKATEKTAPLPAKAGSKASSEADEKDNVAPYEIWYKVRLPDNPVVAGGYVYGGSVEIDIPIEIQYFFQPDKKIVGWQKLGAIKDAKGQDNYHYAIFEKSFNVSDEKSDFDYIHIVGFDPKNKSVSYYNVLRETMRGEFPVTVNVEGTRATFQFNALDQNNQAKMVQYTVVPGEKGRLFATPPDGATNPKDPRRK